MGLAPVKKVEIYGLQTEKDILLKELQEAGVLEITEFSVEETTESTTQYPEKLHQDYLEVTGRLDRRLAEISRALGILDQIAPVRPTMIQQFAGVKTYLTSAEVKSLLTKEERLEQVIGELLRIDQDLTGIQTRKNQLDSLLEQFRPWEGLDLQAEELKGSATTQVLLGAIEGSTEELAEALSESDAAPVVETLAADNKGSLFIIFFLREKVETVQSILNNFGVTVVTLPQFEGTAAQKIQEIKGETQNLSRTEDELHRKAGELAKERPLLQVFYDALTSQRRRNDLQGQLLFGERSFGVRGWMVAAKVDWLKGRLSQAKLQYVLTAEDSAEGDNPPVVLKNSKLITPFEYLVQSFSYPQSHEIDPTPAITPFFFVFFGIALGDAGYGLFLTLLCAVLLLKLKMGPVGRKLSWMFLLSGLAATGFGLFTGSVLSLPNIKFGVFNPLENPIMLLLIVLALGLIQLYFGVILSALGHIKDGRWADVIWGQGFWLLFLTSVILILAKDAIGLGKYAKELNYLILFASAGVVYAATRDKKGILKKLLAIPGGFFTIYGSIGFFSDVLSYSRLMALGLSGGVMGGIMNQLAWMVVESIPYAGWVLGAFIFLFGHLLNVGLGILGAYVHSSRLQYLEFFGKFFEGGGKPLTPLKVERKYTFLVDEREA